MKKAYRMELKKDGVPVNVDLRLTLGGQLSLRKKFNENALGTLFGGMDDPTKMVAVFDEALNFSGNENTITSGAELYDLIVDNDLGGVSGFQKILSSSGRASGLLSEEEKAAVDKKSEGMVAELMNSDPNAELLQQLTK